LGHHLHSKCSKARLEYIPGPKNVVADFLSRLPTKQVQIKEEEEVLDINDNNYEINVIDSSALKPRSHSKRNKKSATTFFAPGMYSMVQL
jgi:hypothetical protein